MSTLRLDAEALYAELLGGVRSLLRPDMALVGTMPLALLQRVGS